MASPCWSWKPSESVGSHRAQIKRHPFADLNFKFANLAWIKQQNLLFTPALIFNKCSQTFALFVRERAAWSILVITLEDSIANCGSTHEKYLRKNRRRWRWENLCCGWINYGSSNPTLQDGITYLWSCCASCWSECPSLSLDLGLCNVTCFGQQHIRGYDFSRSLKKMHIGFTPYVLMTYQQTTAHRISGSVWFF